MHITLIMFIVRGVIQVLDLTVNRAVNMSVSGIAGIGHILLAVGLISFLSILNSESKKLSN